MRAEWQAFMAAWAAQTRGPALAGADRHAAGAGLLIGGFGALVLWGAAHLWPASVAVVMALAGIAALTRARHEQGVQAHFGTVGQLAVLALKAAALLGLVTRDFPAALAALPLAHAVSRSLMAPGPMAWPWALLAVAAAVAFHLQLADALVAAVAAAVVGWVVGRGLPAGATAQGVVQQAAETALLLGLLAALAYG